MEIAGVVANIVESGIAAQAAAAPAAAFAGGAAAGAALRRLPGTDTGLFNYHGTERKQTNMPRWLTPRTFTEDVDIRSELESVEVGLNPVRDGIRREEPRSYFDYAV
jgi:hypothetical protein